MDAEFPPGRLPAVNDAILVESGVNARLVAEVQEHLDRRTIRAVAMMGRFGWTIVTPIVLGAFVGRWLDRTFNSGVFWSAALVFAGAAAGFWPVWKRMNSE